MAFSPLWEISSLRGCTHIRSTSNYDKKSIAAVPQNPIPGISIFAIKHFCFSVIAPQQVLRYLAFELNFIEILQEISAISRVFFIAIFRALGAHAGMLFAFILVSQERETIDRIKKSKRWHRYQSMLLERHSPQLYGHLHFHADYVNRRNSKARQMCMARRFVGKILIWLIAKRRYEMRPWRNLLARFYSHRFVLFTRGWRR